MGLAVSSTAYCHGSWRPREIGAEQSSERSTRDAERSAVAVEAKARGANALAGVEGAEAALVGALARTNIELPEVNAVQRRRGHRRQAHTDVF
jgi:hypothetical protein